jgi:hypothetical protein
MPRSHMIFNWGVLGVLGKGRRYPFQWNWSHVQIHSEETGIIKTIGCTESVLVLCCHFWPLSVYHF